MLDRDILKIFFNPVLLPPSYLYLLWFLPFFYFFICDLFKPWDVLCSLRFRCCLAWSDKRISCLADSWFDLMVWITLYIHHASEADEVEMRQGSPSYIIAPACHSPPNAWSIHYSVTKRNGNRNIPINLQSIAQNSRTSDQMGNVACHALFVANHGNKFLGTPKRVIIFHNISQSALLNAFL